MRFCFLSEMWRKPLPQPYNLFISCSCLSSLSSSLLHPSSPICLSVSLTHIHKHTHVHTHMHTHTSNAVWTQLICYLIYKFISFFLLPFFNHRPTSTTLTESAATHKGFLDSLWLERHCVFLRDYYHDLHRRISCTQRTWIILNWQMTFVLFFLIFHFDIYQARV